MNNLKSSALHLVPNAALVKRSPGLGIGQSLLQLIERLLGKRFSAPQAALRAASVNAGHDGEVLPHEFACASEHEAIKLCQNLIARGHAAEVHYDVYDYSWSVEVSAVADRAQ